MGDLSSGYGTARTANAVFAVDVFALVVAGFALLARIGGCYTVRLSGYAAMLSGKMVHLPHAVGRLYKRETGTSMDFARYPGLGTPVPRARSNTKFINNAPSWPLHEAGINENRRSEHATNAEPGRRAHHGCHESHGRLP